MFAAIIDTILKTLSDKLAAVQVSNKYTYDDTISPNVNV